MAIAQEAVQVRAPPPSRLRPIQDLRWACLSREIPDFAKKPYRNDTEPRKAGRRYEYKAQEYLLRRHSRYYIASPWVHFKDNRNSRSWCQPDGWLIDFDRGLITIVEIKLNHTTDAWWQVKHLYEPVTRFLFGPEWHYAACEVTRHYDPHIQFPESVSMTPDVSMLWNSAFGVHVWRP